MSFACYRYLNDAVVRGALQYWNCSIVKPEQLISLMMLIILFSFTGSLVVNGVTSGQLLCGKLKSPPRIMSEAWGIFSRLLTSLFTASFKSIAFQVHALCHRVNRHAIARFSDLESRQRS